jgi:single-stranded DNA-binding protein
MKLELKMAIWSILDGNLATQPTKKTVMVEGEERQAVELLVFSDVGRRINDEWVQDEEKSGLVEVTVWQEKLGDAVFSHLRKGARVEVKGNLHLRRFKDGDGNPASIQRMTAETVTLSLYRINKIDFKPSQRSLQQAGDALESGVPA